MVSHGHVGLRRLVSLGSPRTVRPEHLGRLVIWSSVIWLAITSLAIQIPKTGLKTEHTSWYLYLFPAFIILPALRQQKPNSASGTRGSAHGSALVGFWGFAGKSTYFVVRWFFSSCKTSIDKDFPIFSYDFPIQASNFGGYLWISHGHTWLRKASWNLKISNLRAQNAQNTRCHQGWFPKTLSGLDRSTVNGTTCHMNVCCLVEHWLMSQSVAHHLG